MYVYNFYFYTSLLFLQAFEIVFRLKLNKLAITKSKNP